MTTHKYVLDFDKVWTFCGRKSLRAVARYLRHNFKMKVSTEGRRLLHVREFKAKEIAELRGFVFGLLEANYDEGENDE